ncbi:MAG: hypothetical protein WB564_09235 [Dehalococcoidia bacterium]
MAKIKVTRKDHVRKNGTVVKGTTYYTKDRGKSGKTPESEKWYQHNVEMHWHKHLPAELRRANAVEAHEGDELATTRALQSLANVTTDAETSKIAKIDADYFFTKHQ